MDPTYDIENLTKEEPKLWSEDNLVQNHQIKCGEVFCYNSGTTFCIICNTCFESFDNFDIFQDHYVQCYTLSQSNENCEINDENDFLVDKYDPLHSILADQVETESILPDDYQTFNEPITESYDQISSISNQKLKNLPKRKINKKPKKTLPKLTRNKNSNNKTITQMPKDFIDLDLQCEICSKYFRSKTKLRQHAIVHSERRYDCELCGKSFVTPFQLKSHFRLHTGERPYKCNYCEKSFAHATSLKVHIYFHTGERPHVCLICNKGFYSTSDLKSHRNTHLGISTYKKNKSKLNKNIQMKIKCKQEKIT